MDDGALRWLFLIHIKSSSWGTTAKSLTWTPGDRLRTPWCTPPLNPHTLHLLIFATNVPPCEWYPQKTMTQLWLQSMGRGFNSIGSIFSPCFIDLELLYTNAPALQPFSKEECCLFAFLASKILQNCNLEKFECFSAQLTLKPNASLSLFTCDRFS